MKTNMLKPLSTLVLAATIETGCSTDAPMPEVAPINAVSVIEAAPVETDPIVDIVEQDHPSDEQLLETFVPIPKREFIEHIPKNKNLMYSLISVADEGTILDPKKN